MPLFRQWLTRASNPGSAVGPRVWQGFESFRIVGIRTEEGAFAAAEGILDGTCGRQGAAGAASRHQVVDSGMAEAGYPGKLSFRHSDRLQADDQGLAATQLHG
jgi:hypothetical protein